ncbi:MAG: hypothetical protein DRJ03_28530 [Chloroflexi bacterium]|nr:MAG: hypothetical protein DRJ03_28530 [Chloroflexota bacterium]
MKRMTKQLTVLLVAGVVCLVTGQIHPAASPQMSVSETYVYVCSEEADAPYYCDGVYYYGPINYESNYTRHVLANEWPGQAGDEALKTGTIAIRTFGWRELGCGAIDHYYTVGSTQYRVENNLSQAYWLNPYTQAQNPILTKHTNAVNATSTVTMRRGGDYNAACAKYKADCGNPTATGPEENWTLWGVPDPVDSDTSMHLSGMSQNGTHAWELSGYDGAAPLSYRQMLTHYYAQIALSGAPGVYRWTWLDVDTTQTRYGRYYGPKANTPLTMQTGRRYWVPFYIQNTGTMQWNISGTWPEYLSYHWYDSGGANVVIWDGLRSSLGFGLGPAQSTQIQAKVVAPFSPGVYTLKWDMVSEGSFWFSDQGSVSWPTQNVAINVQPSADLVHLPYVKNSSGWISTITIHNNSSSAAEVDVTYMAGGRTDSSFSHVVSAYGTINVTPPVGFFGSAWVAADRDITVSVSPEPEQVFLPLALKDY